MEEGGHGAGRRGGCGRAGVPSSLPIGPFGRPRRSSAASGGVALPGGSRRLEHPPPKSLDRLGMTRWGKTVRQGQPRSPVVRRPGAGRGSAGRSVPPDTPPGPGRVKRSAGPACASLLPIEVPRQARDDKAGARDDNKGPETTTGGLGARCLGARDCRVGGR